MEVFPFAEHLNLEEVDYELAIRGELDDDTAKLDLGNKQRRLRILFKADARNSRNHASPYDFKSEHGYIEGRVNDLIRAIGRDGVLLRYEWRMLHYWHRIRRSNVEGTDQERKNVELIDRMGGVMIKFKIVFQAALGNGC